MLSRIKWKTFIIGLTMTSILLMLILNTYLPVLQINNELNKTFKKSNNLPPIHKNDLEQLLSAPTDKEFIKRFGKLMENKNGYYYPSKKERITDDPFYSYSTPLHAKIYKIILKNSIIDNNRLIMIYSDFISDRNIYITYKMIANEYKFLFLAIQKTHYYQNASKEALQQLLAAIPSEKECLLGYYIFFNSFGLNLNKKNLLYIYKNINEKNYKDLITNKILFKDMDIEFICRNIGYYYELKNLLKNSLENLKDQK